MSNGTPEPSEPGPDPPPGLHVFVALAYAVLWILGTLASLVIGTGPTTRSPWSFGISLALFVVAMVVILREMGILGRARSPDEDGNPR
jgi:hypothetical protein